MPVNGLQQHYLRPLLLPRERGHRRRVRARGIAGRIVFENVLGGGFVGSALRRQSQASRSPRSPVVAEPCGDRRAVDLALIAAPPERSAASSTTRRPRACARRSCCRIRRTATSRSSASGRATSRSSRRKRGVRLVGPGAFGVVRTDIGLNATISACRGARAGSRSSRSRARCARRCSTSRRPLRHRLLDGGLARRRRRTSASASCSTRSCSIPTTDGILLYVERCGDARAFLSALRAAARTKPVVVLKAGRSRRSRAAMRRARRRADAVFDAAMRRAGTVRVRTYTQLFAAARILALGRIPRGDRLAIVANGRGPALLAADAARESRRAPRASSPTTRAARSTRCCRRTATRAIPSTCAATRRPSASPAAVAAVLAGCERRRGRRAARAATVDRRRRRRTRGRRGRARREQAGARRVARRDRPAECRRRSKRAASRTSTRRRTRSRRSRSSRLPPQPGVAARSAAVAAGAASRRTSPRREAVRAKRSGERRTTLSDDAGVAAARGVRHPRVPAALVAQRARGEAAARALGYPVTLDARRARRARVAQRVGTARWPRGRARVRALHADAAPRARRRTDRRHRAQGTGAARRCAGCRSASYTDATFGPVIALRRERARRVAHAVARADAAAAQPPARARPRGRPACARAERSVDADDASEALVQLAAQAVGARVRAALGRRARARSGRRRRRARPRSAARASSSISRRERVAATRTWRSIRIRWSCRRTCALRDGARVASGRSGPRTRSSSARSSTACPSRRATSASSIGCTSSRRRCSRASRRSTTTASSRWSRSRRPRRRRRACVRRRRALHRESRPATARSSRSSSPTPGRGGASAAALMERLIAAREAQGPRAARRRGAARELEDAAIRRALGFVVTRPTPRRTITDSTSRGATAERRRDPYAAMRHRDDARLPSGASTARTLFSRRRAPHGTVDGSGCEAVALPLIQDKVHAAFFATGCRRATLCSRSTPGENDEDPVCHRRLGSRARCARSFDRAS